MMKTRLTAALSALGLIFCAPAWAGDCVQNPSRPNQCFDAVVVVDPLTGQQVIQPTKQGAYSSAGTSQYAVALSTGSATSLTVPTGSIVAQICVETAAARYRDDGPAPTSTVGMPVAAGTCFQYSGPLSAIKFIAQTGSPTLDVSYYK